MHTVEPVLAGTPMLRLVLLASNIPNVIHFLPLKPDPSAVQLTL